MYNELKTVIVIPVYNEERLIADTIKGVPKYIDKIAVVDDGSTDSSIAVVKKIKDKRIHIISHKKNSGLGSAIVSGYKFAIANSFDIAVVVGGDNQMDLAELSYFLEPIANDEADYVKGNRFLNSSYKKMPLRRLIGNIILSFIEKPATGYWNLFDMHDGYTAINKKALKAVDWDYVWKGYAYNVDFLARLNVKNMRVKDISREAIYLKGEKQSKIKILGYVSMAIPLIIKTFFWRLNQKYFKLL